MSAVPIDDDDTRVDMARWTGRGERSLSSVLADLDERRRQKAERLERDHRARRTAEVRGRLLSMTDGQRREWLALARDAVIRAGKGRLSLEQIRLEVLDEKYGAAFPQGVPLVRTKYGRGPRPNGHVHGCHCPNCTDADG